MDAAFMFFTLVSLHFGSVIELMMQFNAVYISQYTKWG